MNHKEYVSVKRTFDRASSICFPGSIDINSILKRIKREERLKKLLDE